MSHTKPQIVSAIGAVPKSDGGYRLIHDCSLPQNGGVNSFAPEFDKYSYESVDTATTMVKPGYYMAKVDIKSAYRHIPIHPRSQRASGLQWSFSNGEECFLYDVKLPFGARASPTIFHRISQAVKRMLQRRGYDLVVAYQDDFLVIGETYEQCLEVWLELINLLLKLGFEINFKKLAAPSTCVTFLGIQLDSQSCELTLPADKLRKIRDNVGSFVHMKRASKRQLQSLAGSLNFAAKVVRGGRVFLRRILNSIQQLKRPNHKVRLDGAVRADILWWHAYLQEFNGVAAFMDERPITPILTDACRVSGGAFCNGDFMYVNWTKDHPEIAGAHINYKEAMMAVLGIHRWGPMFANRTLYIYCDNTCAVSIINKCTCRNETLMQAIRSMFWLSAKYNFSVKAVYMPGCKHIIADTVSRLHEPGNFLYWETLINDWYACHQKYNNALVSFNLLNHMTLASMSVILKQVMKWRTLRGCWTEK